MQEWVFLKEAGKLDEDAILRLPSGTGLIYLEHVRNMGCLDGTRNLAVMVCRRGYGDERGTVRAVLFEHPKAAGQYLLYDIDNWFVLGEECAGTEAPCLKEAVRRITGVMLAAVCRKEETLAQVRRRYAAFG